MRANNGATKSIEKNFPTGANFHLPGEFSAERGHSTQDKRQARRALHLPGYMPGLAPLQGSDIGMTFGWRAIFLMPAARNGNRPVISRLAAGEFLTSVLIPDMVSR
jgi:hypothetical protein